jgi:hypothetical protein
MTTSKKIYIPMSYSTGHILGVPKQWIWTPALETEHDIKLGDNVLWVTLKPGIGATLCNKPPSHALATTKEEALTKR